MKKRKFNAPKWENDVKQTIKTLRKNSKTRALKSDNFYECCCIFINDHFNKGIFSNSTIGTYYAFLKLFSQWLDLEEQVTNIKNINVPHLHKYFQYLKYTKKYKTSSLESVFISLDRFFHSMKLRRITSINPCKDFKIVSHRNNGCQKVLTPFDIKILLRSVKEHYEYLKDNNKLDKFSLFIHHRDLCVLSLCTACGLRRGEIQKIKNEDVDFEKKIIRVTGKGNQRVIIKERTAFISHFFIEEAMMKYFNLRKKLSGNSFFCNCYGDELTLCGIYAIFRRYSAFNFKDIIYTPTLTRKSFSTHLVHKKVNIEAIRNLLGHENCETTLKYYVHFSNNNLESIWKETNPYDNNY